MGNSEISGSLSGRIGETLIYGEEKNPDADLKIGKNKESAVRFRQTSENVKNWKEKKYKERNHRDIEEIGNSG